MPGLSGIEFIKTVRHKNYHFILTTAYREFASEGFDLDVIDYLVKPIPLPRLLQAVTKAQKSIDQQIEVNINDSIETDYFMVKTTIKGKMVKINLLDIDYIQGMKNYVAFHHNDTRTLALITLKDIEERLPCKYFIRVQKSFIIAINKITALDGNRIILKGVSAEILVGETYKKQFMETVKKKQMR